MTKKHFEHAAEMVRAILEGHWTGESPAWSPIKWGPEYEVDAYDLGNIDRDVVRAVQTAEAFIILAKEFNPRFDESRFLIACGLKDAPKKGRR
jgi:hypothetical protein